MAAKRSGSIRVSMRSDPSPRVLIKRFDFLKDVLRDLRPVWDDLAPRMRHLAASQFDSKGSRAGGKWQELSSAYGSRKRGGSLLVRTGHLRRRLVDKGVVSKTKGSFRFGVKAPGARSLYFGSKKQNIPPRPFIVATDEVEEAALQSTMEYLDVELQRFVVPTGRALGNAFIRGRQ